jgi:FlaA1/EpsC-like NDP-sugar epimerase
MSRGHVRMEKIVIFGASLGGERGLRSLPRGQQAVAFCDNSKAKHGTQFHGLPVIAPEAIRDTPHDRVLIASSYYEQIFDQLVALGLPAERIDVLEAHLLEGKPDPAPRATRLIAGLVIAASIIGALALYGLYHLIVGCR